jgi:hypothetical protein
MLVIARKCIFVAHVNPDPLLPNQGTRKSAHLTKSAAYKAFAINELVETCRFRYISVALAATISIPENWGEPLHWNSFLLLHQQRFSILNPQVKHIRAHTG